jgi:hypothetical protein
LILLVCLLPGAEIHALDARLSKRGCAYAASVRTFTTAEPFSLFNPQVREAHFKALDQLTKLAAGGVSRQ